MMKIKKAVNQMELDAANNKNMLARLQEMCDSAAERARKAEALAEAIKTDFQAGDDATYAKIQKDVRESVENLTIQLLESSERAGGDLEGQVAALRSSFKKELSVEIKNAALVNSAAFDDLAEKVQNSSSVVSSKLALLEESQGTTIQELVKQTLQGATADDIEEKKQVQGDVTFLKEGYNEAKREAKESADANSAKVAALEEEVKKHSAQTLDAMRKDVQGQTKDLVERFEDMSDVTNRNKAGLMAMDDSIHDLKALIASSVENLKKETKEANTKVLEQSDKTKSFLTSSIADVVESAKYQQTSMEDELQNINDENVSMQSAIADVTDDINKLATREEMWDVIETKLTHHVKTLSKECTILEEAVQSNKPQNLPPHLQRYLAGNTQRIAKLLATKADFEVIRRIVVHSDPASFDWDAEVTALRTDYKNKFIERVREEARKKHPMTDHLIDEARGKFLLKLDLATKVAISKYARVQIGQTLLGRRQMIPTCMACDRPFGETAGGDKGPGGGGRSKTPAGDTRAMSRDILPSQKSSLDGGGFDNDDSTIASYQSMESSKNSGYQVVPFGVDQRKLDKYVFRSGFKIPKHVSSPLSIGNSYQDMYDDESSVGSMLSDNSHRPHTVAFSEQQPKGPRKGSNTPAKKVRKQDDYEIPLMTSSKSSGNLPTILSPQRY